MKVAAAEAIFQSRLVCAYGSGPSLVLVPYHATMLHVFSARTDLVNMLDEHGDGMPSAAMAAK